MVGFVQNQSRGWGGEGGPTCPPLEEKEFDCLRLTVTAPEGHKSEQKLPVMVWIHG
jgi:carboxylesterase type B